MPALWSGCFRPEIDVGDCVIPCDSECPDGFSCQNGFCSRRPEENACAANNGHGGATAHGGATDHGGNANAGGATNGGSCPACTSTGGASHAGGAEVVGAGGVPDGAGGKGLVGAAGSGSPDGGVGGDPGRGGSGGGDLGPRIVSDGPAREPCSGFEYHAKFKALEAAEPYTLSAVSLPNGFTFDSSSRELRGTAATAEKLTVKLQVVDAAGANAEQTISLAPRDTCWLAYLAAPNGPATLQFYDPVLDQHRAFSNRNASEVATDLRFSPDGRLLAYRLRAEDGSYRVSVRGAPTFDEITLSEHGSVVDYAWSENSDVLALVFQDQGQHKLGGLRVTSRPAPAEPAWQTLELAPIDADVRSPIAWFQHDFLAYLGTFPRDPLGVGIHATRVGDDRFAAPVPNTLSQYNPGAALFGVASGVFIVDTPKRQSDFFSYLGDVLTPHPSYTSLERALFDPTGRYAARTNANKLGVYDLADGVVSLKIPLASADGCKLLLAWAPRAERFACVAETQSGSEARLFTLANDASSLTATSVNGSYDYPTGVAAFYKRALSPSGNWFAFSTETSLYVADAHGGAPWLVRKDNLLQIQASDPNVSRVELAFSPDERFLLQHRSSQLSLHRLDNTAATPLILQGVGNSMSAPSSCESDFVLSPRTFCGTSQLSPYFAWAPNSRFVALLLASGELMIKDLGSLNVDEPQVQSISFDFVERACGANCQFAFQP